MSMDGLVVVKNKNVCREVNLTMVCHLITAQLTSHARVWRFFGLHITSVFIENVFLKRTNITSTTNPCDFHHLNVSGKRKKSLTNSHKQG